MSPREALDFARVRAGENTPLDLDGDCLWADCPALLGESSSSKGEGESPPITGAEETPSADGKPLGAADETSWVDDES